MLIPSEVDTTSYEGLTRLLRFGIRLRENPDDHAELDIVEKRLALPAYHPKYTGALEDYVRRLDELDHNQRFETVYNLIAGLLDEKERLGAELTENLLRLVGGDRIVRFSFTPSLLICLYFAQNYKFVDGKRHPIFSIRYAGIGPDKALMAAASIFLNLPIYTESGLPWAEDVVFIDIDGDEEPNTESPDCEVSFPPPTFEKDNAPELEMSVRRSKLPRAVDRGRYDLESVMLDYLAGRSTSPALVFVSQDFLSSTKQSRLLTRQLLIDNQRIVGVKQLYNVKPPRFLVTLASTSYLNDTVYMRLGFKHQVQRLI